MKRTRTRTRTEVPDVRDGLTRTERVVLVALQKLTAERNGRAVSAMELYGRLTEELDLTQREFQEILARLAGRASK